MGLVAIIFALSAAGLAISAAHLKLAVDREHRLQERRFELLMRDLRACQGQRDELQRIVTGMNKRLSTMQGTWRHADGRVVVVLPVGEWIADSTGLVH